MAVMHDGRVLDANDLLATWLDVPGTDLAGRALIDLLTPDRRGSSTADMLAAVIAGPSSGPLDVRITASDDAGRTLSISALGLDDGHRLVTLEDVTDQRRVGRELTQWRTALEKSLNGYHIMDASGAFVYANRAYLDMWGYDSLDQLRGTLLSSLCADPDTARTIVEDIEAHGQTTLEFEARKRDGTPFEVLMAARAAQDERGNNVYVATSLDISEQRRLRGEIAHLQRVEAVGALAASVAHDFNNMLSPILGFTDLLLADGDLREDQRRQLDQVRVAAERSRDLTSQLLAFGRKQVLRPRPTDVRETVRKLEGLITRVLRADIHLDVQLSEEPCMVMADPTQLHQMLLNLATNAQDAMPSGGVLTIRIGKGDPDNIPRKGKAVRYGKIVVSDTGEGLSTEAREHLFEPFFTTKGKFGTGLGLASVQGIVQQHGGQIDVHSEPGSGTTFTLYLPLTKGKAKVSASALQSTLDLGDAIVLLVEDNDLVLTLARRVLGDAGYAVHAMSNGEQALELVNDSAVDIDLLLTDIVLPDINGQKLAESALARRPGLHVLYMSGYPNELVENRGVMNPSTFFLPKPFSAQELLTKVREALGREARH